jgi:hypothetical protein
MTLEDVIVVIYPDHVALYCNPESYPVLLPLLSLWGSGTRIYCCTEKLMEDPDEAEEFKIGAFVAMMAGAYDFKSFI